MKAIVQQQYGSPGVLTLKEVDIPVPKPNEVLVRVHATTATAADMMMRKGKPYVGRLYTGLKGPKRIVPGFEFAGEVVATGKEVTLFKISDKVFGGTTSLGSYAEYVCVNENDVITTMPGNTSFAEAAPVTGSAITVMNFLLGLGKIKPGDKVLVNGASGALGTYAIQLAKHFGAEVTAVCSGDNRGLVKILGADETIDYRVTDFTKKGKLYDIIFDTVGKSSFKACKKSLTRKGVYLSAVIGPPLFIEMILTSITGGKKAKSSATGMLPVKKRLAYLTQLKPLLESGKIKTIIDHHYPLHMAAEAHEYVESGHKTGSVIITV